MKRYIKSSQRFVKDPMDRLYSKLGLSTYYDPSAVSTASFNKCNFVLRPDRCSDRKGIDYYIDRIKKIGGKYITKRYGDIYFYYDMSALNDEYKRDKQQAEDDYSAELNAMDIDQYKPTDAIIKKLIGYRDKGSNVNVKAIKDLNKLLTYYYASKIIGWEDLEDAVRRQCPYQYKDLLNAIGRRVQSDTQYADTRNKFEIGNNIPPTNGLLTFEDNICLVPKPILMYFINNQIPVHFGKRTMGGQYNRHGADWTEIEHLTFYPDSDNPLTYDIAVVTDEGLGPSKFIGLPGNGRGYQTDWYTSAKKVLENIEEYLRTNNEG